MNPTFFNKISPIKLLFLLLLLFTSSCTTFNSLSSLDKDNLKKICDKKLFICQKIDELEKSDESLNSARTEYEIFLENQISEGGFFDGDSFDFSKTANESDENKATFFKKIREDLEKACGTKCPEKTTSDSDTSGTSCCQESMETRINKIDPNQLFSIKSKLKTIQERLGEKTPLEIKQAAGNYCDNIKDDPFLMSQFEALTYDVNLNPFSSDAVTKLKAFIERYCSNTKINILRTFSGTGVFQETSLETAVSSSGSSSSSSCTTATNVGGTLSDNGFAENAADLNFTLDGTNCITVISFTAGSTSGNVFILHTPPSATGFIGTDGNFTLSSSTLVNGANTFILTHDSSGTTYTLSITFNNATSAVSSIQVTRN